MHVKNWKARDFLNQLKKLDKMIENKQIEKEQWRSIAMGTTSGGQSVQINGVMHNMEKVQSSGSQQKMADAVDRFVDIEREIDSFIDRLVDTKKDVISVIEQLKASEYDMMHKIYVQYMTLQDVADLYGKSISWAKSIHKKGLKNTQRILDERSGITQK